ncbi:MAG: hypothetical protein QOD71_2045 [Thermoleophilaceae bacterium]|jgi:hypothetical protein|nr:hypothetical protein [Thermoleophilaceae bacterium]
MRLQWLALLVAAGAAVSACGSSASPTVLDTEKLERAIERSSRAQRGVDAHVSCPSGTRQKQGLTFSCTAVVDRRTTRFVAIQVDGSGHVRYEGR